MRPSKFVSIIMMLASPFVLGQNLKNPSKPCLDTIARATVACDIEQLGQTSQERDAFSLSGNQTQDSAFATAQQQAALSGAVAASAMNKAQFCEHEISACQDQCSGTPGSAGLSDCQKLRSNLARLFNFAALTQGSAEAAMRMAATIQSDGSTSDQTTSGPQPIKTALSTSGQWDSPGGRLQTNTSYGTYGDKVWAADGPVGEGDCVVIEGKVHTIGIDGFHRTYCAGR